jgi:hypothetical protein
VPIVSQGGNEIKDRFRKLESRILHFLRISGLLLGFPLSSSENSMLLQHDFTIFAGRLQSKIGLFTKMQHIQFSGHLH